MRQKNSLSKIRGNGSQSYQGRERRIRFRHPDISSQTRPLTYERNTNPLKPKSIDPEKLKESYTPSKIKGDVSTLREGLELVRKVAKKISNTVVFVVHAGVVAVTVIGVALVCKYRDWKEVW